jgi:hypothetical protein
MRTPTPAPVADPWAPSDVDSGWRDIVVSSAPPPPPAEAFQPMRSPINSTVLRDLHTWQEHGTGRAAAAAAPIEEPNFNASDRRLWRAAGALMALATLVLAALGLLTFGGARSIEGAIASTLGTSATTPHAIEAAAIAPAAATSASTRVATTTAAPVAVAFGPVNNPHALKHSKHGKHHKPIASR